MTLTTIPISMPDIKDRLNTVLNKWMGFRGDERRAVSLLVGLLADRNMPLDLRFLVAAQALEAMARVGVDLEELTVEEFQRRLDVVAESIRVPKVCDWALRKLRDSNRRPLAQLLEKLASGIGDYVEVLAPDRNQFLRDIRNNRNNYTHRNEGGDNLFYGEKLLVLTEGTVCLLRAAILRHLGFTKKETHDIMMNCADTSMWTKRVAVHYPVS